MKVPVSWIRDLTSLPSEITTTHICDTLTRAGLQVEKVEMRGSDITGPVVVGQVKDFVDEPQKNGKIIRWCQVDVGEDKPRGIVCGAHNFSIGDYVVVALPGAVLPQDFAIAARKTYGHISDGMMCATDELGLGGAHEGIMILPDSIDGEPLVLGSDAVELLKMRDEIMEIDVTPDLGYCMSMRGIAREICQGFAISFNDPYSGGYYEPEQGGYPVRIESDHCDLFVAISVDGFNPNAETPTWMSSRLIAAGMRPISLGVDITNYVMLESGQPLHAYDAKALTGAIVVRQAYEGEILTTLDGIERTLVTDDLVIADDSGALGLAGVMGGASTELSETSCDIVLEAACFSPEAIGRSFRRHKLPSEASSRFARGTDPHLPYAAAQMAARLMVELGGGQIRKERTVVGAVAAMPSCTIPADLPARVLGTQIKTEQVVEIFRASHIEVAIQDGEVEYLTLTPPSWRRDLVDPYDYVEEVACKLGFDIVTARMPLARPQGGYTFAQQAKRAVMNALAEAGFTELITLPFMADEDCDRLQLPTEDRRRNLVRLANPLDETHPYMRTTLLPGLIAAALRNASRSQEDLAIIETGSVFIDNDCAPSILPNVSRRPSDDEIEQVMGNLPDQPRMIAALLSGYWIQPSWDHDGQRADWRHAVYAAQVIASTLGLTLIVRNATCPPWHPGRCAELVVASSDGDVVVGYAGQLHPSVVAAYSLPEATCACECNLDEMIRLAPRSGQVKAVSSYPLNKEDIALVVNRDMPASEVEQAIIDGAGPLLESVRLFDIFTSEQIGDDKKSLTFALNFRAPDRTLTDKEVAQLRAQVIEMAAERCQAHLRA